MIEGKKERNIKRKKTKENMKTEESEETNSKRHKTKKEGKISPKL